jgi:hypothetical protein
MDKIKELLQDVEIELRKARIKYKPFNSSHEGYAVIKEELDELWELVRKNKGYKMSDPRMEKECIQIAAMALAFIIDLEAL